MSTKTEEISKLIKEEELLKEKIKKLKVLEKTQKSEKELLELYNKKNKLTSKRWNLEREIEESKLSPSQKRRSEEINKIVKRQSEMALSSRNELEKRLSPKQKKLRKDVLEMLHCIAGPEELGYWRIYAKSSEEAENQIKVEDEKIKKSFKEILDLINTDPQLIREILCEGDVIGMTTAPRMFEQLYKKCLEKKALIDYFVHIS